MVRLVRFLDADAVEQYGAEIDGERDTVHLIEPGTVFSPGGPRVTDKVIQMGKRLAPVDPRSILCIGLNYKRHAVECGAEFPENPVVFLKTPNAVQHPGEPILLPRIDGEVDYECELAVVIGRKCKDVREVDALDYVLGYTCANDVSGREWQLKRGGGQWNFGKSFDTFLPLGPVLVTRDEIPDPQALKIGTKLNGETMQDWTTGDMIFSVAQLISFLSQDTTLLPGTVIITGTPQGVGFARKPPIFLKKGDVVTIEIEKIGQLTNPVDCTST